MYAPQENHSASENITREAVSVGYPKTSRRPLSCPGISYLGG